LALAFACALGCISRSSKYAKSVVAPYKVVINAKSNYLLCCALAITARRFNDVGVSLPRLKRGVEVLRFLPPVPIAIGSYQDGCHKIQ
jgi:hypothetical protein